MNSCVGPSLWTLSEGLHTAHSPDGMLHLQASFHMSHQTPYREQQKCGLAGKFISNFMEQDKTHTHTHTLIWSWPKFFKMSSADANQAKGPFKMADCLKVMHTGLWILLHVTSVLEKSLWSKTRIHCFKSGSEVIRS